MKSERGIGNKSTTIDIIKNSNVIIPIDEIAFGGRPEDWNTKIKMTNFIFLRNQNDKLNSNITNFINMSKENNKKLVVMAFSSMPVSKLQMIKIAIKIINNCSVNVIVMSGGDNKDLDAETTKLMNTQKQHLLVEKGAPFYLLFEQMDVLIIHGGLGTTSEALLAGKPIIVTGTLLLDQRFWGQRIFDMNIGPQPTFIDKFYDVCDEYVNIAISQIDEKNWNKNAINFSNELKQRTIPENTLQQNGDEIINIYNSLKR